MLVAVAACRYRFARSSACHADDIRCFRVTLIVSLLRLRLPCFHSRFRARGAVTYGYDTLC